MKYKFKREIRKLYPKSKSILDRIEKNIYWMRKHKLPTLQHPRPDIQLVVPYYSQLIYYPSLLRSREISASFVDAFNKFELFNCVLLSRSACELGAHLYYVNKKLNYHLTKSDWTTLQDVINKFVVGSRAVGGTKPVKSGAVIREIRKIIPRYAENYDYLSEIVHFNIGGKCCYQEIIDERRIKFRLPKRFEEGEERRLLISIVSMQDIIKYLEKPFLERKLPKRLIPNKYRNKEQEK